MKKYVAVAGNIGVGKTTLVRLICERLGWTPFYEPHTENPYLADFYSDMKAWSFHSQVFFLGQRLLIHKQLTRQLSSAVIDRSVYEDAEIFARNLYNQGFVNQRDFDTYMVLYRSLVEFLPPPDLMIYLRASVPRLVQHIELRSRDYERSISAEYLQQLNELYENWIAGFNICPVLTIPADDLDYVLHPSHLDLIVEKVMEKITGKDEVVF